MVEMGVFDLLNFPEKHLLKAKCPQNIGRLGFFKKKAKGYPIKEFIGLRAAESHAAGIKECVRKRVLNLRGAINNCSF